MSGTFSIIYAPSSIGRFRPPRQLLAGCVLASVALHALVLVLLPGRERPATELPVPVLEVVMVTVAPPTPVVAPLPARTPMAVPQPLAEPQQRNMVPPQTNLPVPLVLPQAAAESPSVVTAIRSDLPRVAESKEPARPELPVSPPLFNASYLRNPAPAYPAAARRNGDEGTVMLKVLVNAEGVPLRVDVDHTSGSSPLDGAALDAVRRWRFVPARRGVQNIEGWVRVPVVFRLQSG